MDRETESGTQALESSVLIPTLMWISAVIVAAAAGILRYMLTDGQELSKTIIGALIYIPVASLAWLFVIPEAKKLKPHTKALLLAINYLILTPVTMFIGPIMSAKIF